MPVTEFLGPSPNISGRNSLPHVVALTGGKGGVGKTSVAVNLALTLARLGRKVLLLDADTDLANVSVVLGQYPTRTLEQAISGECELRDVIMEAPHGLHVIPGASGVERCMDLEPADARSILQELAAIERGYDLILIDTASGLRPAGLHMIALAALACVVITPDPASLTDAFSLLKVLRRRGYQRTPGVIVNMAAGASQAQKVYRRFSTAVARHLEMDTRYVGAIWRDESIRQSVEIQRPVAMLPQSDPSCRQFHLLADQLMLQLSQTPRRRAGLAAYWHHRSRKVQAAQDASEPRADQALAEDGADVETIAMVSGKTSAAVPGKPSPDPAHRCRQMLAELESLVASHPGDQALQKEALAGTAALLSRMAASGETVSPVSPEGYSERLLGSQDVLLQNLKSQPDSVRVEEFLTSVIKPL